ncbi:MAG TPA: glycerophosphodiester phosphodiesterase family protein [Solimonas sp.]|nr:glycerophosphodiester phosphodiesterase family protein [Solimonas sp.]
MRYLSLLLLLCLTACGGGSDPGSAGAKAQLHVATTASPEGDAAQPGRLRFRVSLSPAASRSVSVDYATVPDSAQPAADYQDTQGRLQFAAGETERWIEVPLVGDAADEPGERLQLRLSNPSGAGLGSASGWGYLGNDDAACQAALTSNPWLDRHPLNFAHRGGVFDFPENTLYAYRKAYEAGADVLEMDVYQTADGELAILHDLTVDRTTDGSGDISQLTLAQLKALDAAYWFVDGEAPLRDQAESAYRLRGIATGHKRPPPGYSADDFRIPTLEEALQALPHALINIELKPSVNGLGSYEGQVAQLLRRYGRIDDVMVASFLDPPLALFKAQAPCVPTSVPTATMAALLVASQGPLPMLKLPGYQALQVPPDSSQISQIPSQLRIGIVSADFVRDAHAAGYAVHVWSINDCPTMLELLGLGVDAIMTDRPLLLEKLLAQPEGARSCMGL